MTRVETIGGFAKFSYDLQKTDRDNLMAVGGETGEGKTCLMLAIGKAYSRIAGTPFSMNNLTWSRKELLKWIDGEGKDRKGQLPEYSVLIPDELIFMFYKRRWFDDAQIEGVETFNTCRDRHLFVIGAVPSFWDLDTAFTKRVRYYIYVHERGVAWVFQKERNPFVNDPWNQRLNMKWFRSQGNPFGLPNFVCELRWQDWGDKERAEYLAVRVKKRVLAKDESHQKEERWKDLRMQRDKAIRLAFKYCGRRHKHKGGMSVREFAEYFDLSPDMTRLILKGVPAKKRQEESDE